MRFAVINEDEKDGLGSKRLPEDAAALVQGTKHSAVGNAGGGEPDIHVHLRPAGHGHGSNAIMFANEVWNDPAAIALLNVFHVERRSLAAAKTTADQQ